MKKFISILLAVSSLAYGCSKTITGPTPQPLSIAPKVGYNQVAIPVTIEGTGFQAVPINILSGNLTTKLPQVYLSTKPLTYLDVTKVSETTIQATVPSGIAVAAGTWVTYSVTVVNPTGKSGMLKNAYIVSSYPPPTISSAFICTNNATGVLTIKGTQFFGTPSVSLINVSSGTKIPFAVNSASSTEITATSSTSVAPGSYNIVVTNPDTQQAQISITFNQINACISISSVSLCSDNGTDLLNIQGTNFYSTPSVSLQNITTGTQYPFTLQTITSTAITSTSSANIPAGVYSIIVTEPDGQQASYPLVLNQIPACVMPSISSIYPMFGWTGSDTNVTITGSNFDFPPTIIFTLTGSTTGTSLVYIAYVSSSQLQAVVPKGMSVGWYNVTVINPDGQQSTYTKGFYVSANPPPVITSISPASGSSNAATPITITGNYFAYDATAETIDSTGASNVCSMSSQSSTIITCTTALLPTGVYVIRVTNTSDNTYYDYSSFVVTNPANNLSGFSESTSQLIIGRQGLASVTGHDNIGDRFIYAIGGDDGAGGHTFDSVEYAQPDRFGNLNPFNLTSPLIYKTTGAAAFQYNGYVYVLGGLIPSGYTSAIERAKILTTDSTPVVSFEGLSAFTMGTLPAGTWVYEVSANLPTGTTYIGESLPSPVVFTTTTQTSSIQVSWQAVKVWSPVTNSFIDATGYNVYRNTPGTFKPVLIAWNINGTGFVDNGTSQPISITDTTSGFPATLQDPKNLSATPSSSGGTLSQGTYYYRISAVNYRGETTALDFISVATTSNTSSVTLTFNPVPAAEYYRVYRSPYPNIPQDNEVLLLPMTLSTTIVDDGGTTPNQYITPSDGAIAPLPYGSLGPFMLASSSLSSARGYLGAAVGHTQTGTVYGYAVGGTATGSTGLSTVDSIQLSASPITEASLTTGSLAGGTYTYAVTAIVPDGELAYAGTLQTSVTGGIQFTWATVPDALSYNIYRDNGTGLEFLANVVSPTTTFSDDNGSVRPNPGELPMGGGIGNIFATAPLQTARYQLSALAADKTNLPLAITDTSSYVYVAGGYNGTVANTIEVSRIQGDGSLNTFQNVTITGSAPRVCGEFFMEDSNNYLYTFGGWNTNVTVNIIDLKMTSYNSTSATNNGSGSGGGLLTPTYLGGGVLLGPYFYFIGGTSNGSPTTLSSDTVLDSIEQVIY
ncbi:MAG: IPT/TIG domain-containing protein [Deltaproteobacteria bacterium]|nr:IPT/TIG domain-containing protein [Deltaproteobacteria bacterium]MCL5276809.1 IPT/TIG domain-containing protein [Deltaproteobacteria bacterium]